ncbi:MAG: protein translocase subunit SecD [Candidatus Nanopelagicales bacterium]
MAAPHQGNPGRTLALLALFVVLLGAWTFWPGQQHTPLLGLDLRGGTQITLSPVLDPGASGTITDDQLNQAVSIIRARVDGFGVAEASVTTQGSGNGASIIVAVPGTLSREQQQAISTTAKLDFRPVLQDASGSPAGPAPSASPKASTAPAPATSKAAAPKPTTSGNGGAVTGGLGAVAPAADPTPSPSPSPTTAAGGLLPPIQSPTDDAAFQAKYAALDCTAADALSGGKAVDPKQYLATCDQQGQVKYLLGPSSVLGTQITGASAAPPQQGIGGWQVNLTFNSDGAAAFLKTTTELSQKQPPQNQFGIVLDGLVVSAPSVTNPIPGGTAMITGSFTQESATALANVLKYGALPITLTASTAETVSASLGQDQLEAGLIAGGIGLLLVVIYLLFYYRALGIIATASLVVAGAITYGLFVVLGRQLGLSLSLASVAGAIVAIGITADSFIVYFERIRDEVREGRSLRTACDTGWARARRTILAADFVSFLAAALLFYVSVGNVRGFAFTLGLTTVVDVGVAFFFTRPLVAIVAQTRWFAAGSSWTGMSPARVGAIHSSEPDPPARPARRPAPVRLAKKES